MRVRKLILLMLFINLACVNRALAAGNFYGSGTTKDKKIAITFDDGPGPATEEILAILNKYNVKAAFFMLGSNVDKRPAMAKEVLAQGHEIGNHSYKHVNLYKYKKTIPSDILYQDLSQGATSIYKATGITPRYARIPHGYYRSWVKEIAQKCNVDIVHWTFGWDWKKISDDEMIAKYLKAVKPGAILLFHDGGSYKKRKKTIRILPSIIKKIQEKNYSIVPLEDLLKQ